MSHLPPLDPPAQITHVTAQYLVAARKYVRRVGRAAALDALRWSLDTSTNLLAVTLWWGGQRSTFGGRPERLGCGGLIEKPLAFHAEHLAVLAQDVNAKGEGPCRTLGRSRHGGSSDAEFEARTGLFIDADGCGAPDLLVDVAHDVGLGYLLQQRPSSGRWHMEIPFAPPIPRPEEAISREALAIWKNAVYRSTMGWLLGFFSELAELDCRFETNAGAISVSHLGADAVPGDRLLALGNPYTRRAEKEAVPTTSHGEGAFLNVARLLEATGYTPPAESKHSRGGALGKRPNPADSEASTPPSGDDGDLFEPEEPEEATAFATATSRAFAAAGHLLYDVKGLAIIRCPFASGHTTGAEGGTSTAILPNGYIKCFHGSCGARSQWDFFADLPPEAQFVLAKALPTIAAESEDALFAPALLKILARLSVADPLEFARLRQETRALPATMDRWMATIRKERRS